jgi:hypothetical protein
MMDLEEAVKVLDLSITLTPDNRHENLVLLLFLRNVLLKRFDKSGSFTSSTDLDDAVEAHRDAVEVTPDSNRCKSACFNYLGVSLLKRFQLNGDLKDVDDAIAVQIRATELTPDGDILLAARLAKFAIFFRPRFGELKEPNGLEIEIAISSRAVALAHNTNLSRLILPIELSILLASSEKEQTLKKRLHCNGLPSSFPQMIIRTKQDFLPD